MYNVKRIIIDESIFVILTHSALLRAGSGEDPLVVF